MNASPSTRGRRSLGRRSSKGLVAMILTVALIAGGGTLVVLAAHLLAPDADRSRTPSALHEVAIVPAQASELTRWLPDSWKRERVLEPGTRTLVAAAYIRAWAALGRYESDGDTNGLVDTFSGPARTTAMGIPHSGGSATWDLHHSLQLEFYALDGATVAFTDVEASVVRTVGSGASETVLLSHESFTVVMVFEDGYWRVRQLQRSAATDPLVVSTSATGSTTVEGQSARSEESRTLGPLLATEYRPRSWAAGAEATVRHDLARARSLGFTGVRVPLPFEAFGSSTPSATAIRSLKALLAIAASDGLTVEPVLLDGLEDLSPASWVAANAQAAAIVSATNGSPAIGAWDLADRPDLRTGGSASRTEIRAFLLQLASTVRQSSAATPVTISFSSTTDALDPAMAGLVDFVSVDLTAPSDVRAAIDVLSTAHRPAMLSVSNLATDGGWSPLPHTEARQASDVASILLSAERSGLARLSIAGFQDSSHRSDGILRADGSAKPAARLFTRGTQLATIGDPTILDYSDSPFWLTAISVVAAFLLGATFRFRHRRR